MVSDAATVQRNEERYRLIFDSAIVGMYLSTRDGRCIAANPAMARMLGYESAQEMTQAIVDARRQVYDDPTVRDTMIRHLETHDFIDRLEWRARRKDGSRVYLSQSARAIRDEQGRMTHVQGIIQDVTAHIQAEADLFATRQHLEYVLAMNPAVTYVLKLQPDGTGRPSWVSDNITRLMGYTVAETLAPAWWCDHVHPDDLEAVRSRLGALEKLGGSVAHYRFRHRDGSYRWVRDEARLVVQRDGSREVVGTWSDVTESRQAQAEIERQQAILAQSQKLADMGTLLAGVAHELNNPLSVILGQTQLLARATRDTPAARRADSIAQAAERCVRIVRNFLGLARQHAPERQRVLLNDVVQEAIELLAYSLRVDDVEVQLALEPRLPAIWADAHQLHQVIVNFLTNAHYAVKLVPRQRRIGLTTCVVEGGVRLSVEDSGPGIPESVAARLFEPFFTTKPEGEGTGLGLSLCRGIVNAHGGRIDAQRGSRLGGACLTIELPIGQAGAAAATLPAALDAAAPRHHVLVVDDERAIAEVIAETLRDVGHRVDVAGGGAEALAKLRRASYDVVLSDIRMPGLDGIGLYEATLARSDADPPTFVFMTGDGLTPRTNAFLAEPGRLHLEKPFRTEQVLGLLHQIRPRLRAVS